MHRCAGSGRASHRSYLILNYIFNQLPFNCWDVLWDVAVTERLFHSQHSLLLSYLLLALHEQQNRFVKKQHQCIEKRSKKLRSHEENVRTYIGIPSIKCNHVTITFDVCVCVRVCCVLVVSWLRVFPEKLQHVWQYQGNVPGIRKTIFTQHWVRTPTLILTPTYLLTPH